MRKKSPYLRTSSFSNMAVRGGLTRFARPSGSPFAALSVCPTGCAATRPIPGPRPYGASACAVQNCSRQFCVDPRSGLLIPPQACNMRKKKPVLTYELFLEYGGEGGIDSLRSPFGQPVRCALSLSNWLRRYSAHPWASPLRGQRMRCSKLLPAILCRPPVGASHSPAGVQHAKKKARTYVRALSRIWR